MGGSSVLQTTDGLNFTSVSASYPGGSSRSFVTLPDGRFRMYFFTQPLVQSAVSTNGLNWTTESGSRISLNQFAVPKAVAVPGGGYRIYYTSGSGPILSAFSTDGLTFTVEDANRLTSSSSFNWGDPAVIYTGSEWLMLATALPNDASFSSIWLARSTDGLNWTLDSKALITETAGSPVDAAFLPITGGYRIYYGVVLGGSAGSTNLPVEILSGTIFH